MGEIEDWQSTSNLEVSGNTIRTVNIEYSEENQFEDLNSEQVSMSTYTVGRGNLYNSSFVFTNKSVKIYAPHPVQSRNSIISSKI